MLKKMGGLTAISKLCCCAKSFFYADTRLREYAAVFDPASSASKSLPRPHLFRAKKRSILQTFVNNS